MVWKETKKCKIVFDFLLQHIDCNHVSNIRESYDTIQNFYSDLIEANNWLLTKTQSTTKWFDLKMINITSEDQIPMSTNGSNKFINETIIEHIKKNSVFMSTYSLTVFEKQITIYFVFEDAELSKEHRQPKLSVIESYLKNILLWLYIVNKYSSKLCSPSISFYIYLTSLNKIIPALPNQVLSATHVNTGLTQSCATTHNEIVIYRHEEWFKVLIHESIHAFGLDFNTSGETEIRKTFFIPTEIPILLFEAYTEFWARIINVMIISFHWSNTSLEEFTNTVIFLLDYERAYSFFHMVKVLHLMNIKYSDLYTNQHLLQIYREETNVFVYNVITTILLNDYPLFMKWCKTNNTNMLQFHDTTNKVGLFCNYIKNEYDTASMLDMVRCATLLYNKLYRRSSKLSIRNSRFSSTNSQKTKLDFIHETMRMSLCEVKNI